MRIKQITLYTDKIDELKKFYSNLLGCPINQENDDQFSFQTGWSEITFATKKPASLYHYCFLISSDKLQEAISWLHGKVKLIETDGHTIHHHKNWNAEAIYFYDSAGNIIEFIARHNLHYTTEGAFNFKDILCLNEIGLPSTDCQALNTEITQKIGTNIWKGDLARFIINGDEEGMFLLVNNTIKTKWYPTNVFPESVTIEAKVDVDNVPYRIKYKDNKFSVVL